MSIELKKGFLPDEWQNTYTKVFRALNERDPDPSSGEMLDRRLGFYFSVLAKVGLLKKGCVMADLGAGLTWFAPIASQLGLRVTIVDDFGGGGGVDMANREFAFQTLEKFKELGVQIVEENLLTDPLPFPDESVDVVTCFHCLEHWHFSPVRLFAEIRRVLRAGGCVFIATPNAVNLRKRVSVLFGRTNWSEFSEWYDSELVFRGHVREPVIRDLHELMHRNKLKVIATYGRNFIGADTRKLPWFSPEFIRAAVTLSDNVLRFFPALCSDIHVLGRK